MTRPFLPHSVLARRNAKRGQEADKRDAKRLHDLGQRIADAKAKTRPEAAETRQAMEQAMKEMKL